MSSSLAGAAPVAGNPLRERSHGPVRPAAAVLRPIRDDARHARLAGGAVQRRPDVSFDADRVRILAVDSRPLLRSGLAGVARRAFGTGALPLADLDQARAAVRFSRSTPQALLLGLSSDDEPSELIADARRIAPIVICVLDGSDPLLVRAALAADADGYVMVEEATPQVLTAALDAAEAGLPAVPEALAEIGDVGRLTDRSVAVLSALAAGLHDDEIAERLGISTSSVRKHVANAQQRLGAKTRTQAVATATREGLL